MLHATKNQVTTVKYVCILDLTAAFDTLIGSLVYVVSLCFGPGPTCVVDHTVFGVLALHQETSALLVLFLRDRHLDHGC